MDKEKVIEDKSTLRTEKTSLSISSKLFKEIKEIANENGMSQNATMLMLMMLGKKLYYSKIDFNLED